MANNIDFSVSTNAITVLNQTAGAAENTAKGFTSAKAELRALQNQLQQMDQTSEAFKKASARAAELKDSIGDLSAEISANAGNAFEGVSNNVSLFGSRLMSLDLKGAGQALTAVGAASKKIGFKEMATELGGLTKGILSLGKALLSNPLFLLGSVIAMIVTNFDALSKSGGAIGKILTFIGDIIDSAVKKFTDLTDAIGLTSVAAEKEAERVAKAQAETAEFYDKRIAEVDKKFADRKKKLLDDYAGNVSKAWKAEKEWAQNNLENANNVIKGLEKAYHEQGRLDATQTGALELKRKEAQSLKDYIKKFSDEATQYSKDKANERQKIEDEEIRKQEEADRKELERRKKLNDEMMAEDEQMASIGVDDLIARQKERGDKQLLTEMQIHANLTSLRAEQSQKDIEELKKAEEQKAQLRVDALKTSLSIIGDLAQAFAGKSERQQKKAFQIQKGVSIATATIDTYLAAQGAYASQMSIKTPDAPVRAAIAAGIAIAQGLARVAIISKQQFQGTGGTSGGNNGGGNVPSPNAGTMAPSPANYDFISQQPNQQPPLQAYVLGGQISSNLEAQQLIFNQSKLGG
jgi:hypothetical protein